MISKFIKAVVAVAVLATVSAVKVQALPAITGSIAFSGGDTVDNANLGSATKFTSFNDVTVTPNQHFGSYLSVPNNTPVTFTPFSFNPVAASVTPLWSFTIGATTYSFTATTVTASYNASLNVWNIGGNGTASITGFADSIGTWVVTASQAGDSFSFASQAVTVPDNGTTLILLGAALSVLALAKFRLA